MIWYERFFFGNSIPCLSRKQWYLRATYNDKRRDDIRSIGIWNGNGMKRG